MDRCLVPLLVLGVLAAQVDGASVVPAPNIVLIVADDLGWADLGCYGSRDHETPHLDRLARGGIRFTNGYAACPVCSPSRAAILTGKYPARLHLTDWLPGRTDRPAQKLLRPPFLQQLPLEEVTIAERLKPSGFATASVGKWHLGGPPFGPEHQGFDCNVGGTATGSPPGGYFGFKTPTMMARTSDEYLTDRLTDEAIDFIERNRARRFFLYLPHYAVHIPLQAKPELQARFKARPVGDSPQSNAIYAAMLASLDESVGRIMTTLDRLEIAERTVIIFTSDNGGLSVKEGPNTPATSNAPLRAGKGELYEGGIRVPLIVRWAGVTRPGGTCDVPASGQDLFPTVLELMGVPPGRGQTIDGKSLVPLLKGEPLSGRDALFWHYPHYSNQGGRPGGAIRQGDLKLIERFEDRRVELFDLRADLGERHDLAAERPDEAARLLARLADWRREVGAQLPRPNPDHRPGAVGPSRAGEVE